MNVTDAELFQEVARRSAAREPFVLCTVTATDRSAPRDAGAKMIVAADGAIVGTVGGGPLEAVVIQEAVHLLKQEGTSCQRRFALTTAGDAAEPLPPSGPIPDELGMKCGGEVTVFLDVVRPGPRLVLYGAGHVGGRVASIAAEIGLATTVIDDREKFATRDRFPRASEVRCADLAQDPLGGVAPGASDFVVILTRCHALDEGVLEAALRTPARYIGLIGSRRKVALILRSIARRLGRDHRDLSEEQRAVALCEPRPTLVIAGAGSGKTRALTYRVAHLLETGTPPEKILLLTFTNKAAREMMARVGQLCRVETRRMWGGTFHHVAHGLLREHAPRLGYADRFGLLDREDAKEVMASATADLGYGVGQRRFPRPDAMIDLYSTAVNTQRPLAEVIAAETPQFVVLEEEILRVARRFAERKAQMNAMDFDDLLLNWKRLLIEVPGARESICRRFSAVLVDEYQDTNRLQGEIVEVIAAPHGNLLVVGDDAQSIYAFRGAHFENILKFPERHPQCQELRLITNYRSTPPILALANASISCNRKQFQKELRAHREGGVLPALVPLRDVHQQAEFVAQRVLELREEGIGLREMAVLYRAHTHSMELQMELARRGIPFLVRAGVRFFEQAHIKDVLAHLKFIQNPQDELSFKRNVKLVSGIGEVSADALWEKVRVQKLSGLEQLVPPKARAGLAALVTALHKLDKMRSQPSEMIRCVLHEAGYAEALKMRYSNAQARHDDVLQLADYALQAESLEQLLADS